MRRLLTITGTDRPGLIAAVSGVLAEQGADIEDISMTRLSGNFAMILVARGGNEPGSGGATQNTYQNPRDRAATSEDPPPP